MSKFTKLTVETVPTSIGSCHKIGPLPNGSEVREGNYACIYADNVRIGIDDNNTVAKELKAYALLFSKAPEMLELLKKFTASDVRAEFTFKEPVDPSRFQFLCTKASRIIKEIEGE